jgi:hypothetical protein
MVASGGRETASPYGRSLYANKRGQRARLCTLSLEEIRVTKP